MRQTVSAWILPALGVAALVAVLLGVSAAPAQDASVQYRMGSGDRVRVTVFGHDDLSGEFLVDGSGYISLPLIGNVLAGGLILRELEQAITGALKPDYLKNPRVSIEVLNFRPFYIIGEVNSPGSYPYVSGMTVLNAVAIAGGYTYRAREDDIFIKRAAEPEHGKQQAGQETLVLPGDIVEIPERFF